MKLIWTTDIHLDFVDPVKLDAFCCRITVLKPDVVLIGGDIAESMNLVNILLTLERQIKCPIYFVLGNHDYYHGSIGDVREQVQKMTGGCCRLVTPT